MLQQPSRGNSFYILPSQVVAEVYALVNCVDLSWLKSVCFVITTYILSRQMYHNHHLFEEAT